MLTAALTTDRARVRAELAVILGRTAWAAVAIVGAYAAVGLFGAVATCARGVA